MTMHLVGPYLSTNGKKKGKKKFRNAEEARKARELEESWKDLQKKWGVEAEEKKRARALTAEPLNYSLHTPANRSTKHIPSLNSGAAVATKSEPKVYTGTLIKGIAQTHKSNAVPVISNEEIIEISKMRR